MGCCGRSRSALRESALKALAPLQRAPANVASGTVHRRRAPGLAAMESVRYLERSSVVVYGAMTGRRYAFSGSNPVQSVDARDAGAFWKTRYFRPA